MKVIKKDGRYYCKKFNVKLTAEMLFLTIDDYYNNNISLEGMKKVLPPGSTFEVVYQDGTKDELMVLDYAHDDLLVPINDHTKAFMTLQTKNLVGGPTRYHSVDTSTGGWAVMEFRQKVIEWSEANLPLDLQEKIKTVKKSYTTSNTSTTLVYSEDKYWIPSYAEVMGITSDTTYQPPVREGTQYPAFATTANRIKKNKDDVANYWPIRSVFRLRASNGVTNFVKPDGAVSNSYATNAYYYITSAFCV